MRRLLRAVAGLIVWAIGFSVMYGMQGLVCARGWDHMTIGPQPFGRMLVLIPWFVTLAVLGALCWRLWPRDPRPALLGAVAAGSAFTGLIATLYIGQTALFTNTCS